MNKIFDIFLRYIILIIVAFPNFYLLYLIFTPLTLYPVYFLLNLFYDVSLRGDFIMIGYRSIELIGACIAGSAYYLLLIFNLSVPDVKLKKRFKMLAFAFLAFLVINIIRIFLLSILFLSNSQWFDITHKLFWYVGSIVFVVGIWFFEVKYFKIKKIPIYSDLRFLFKKLK
ncbi:MAG: pacearchaeosortase [Nanoarchaeota archaeon]|nr:pacearchaeosortase [Nanoarchaeota archaeon]